MEITSGVIDGAQKVVFYGPEGIGKSTFVSNFPGALFEDTEGSTRRLNVRRTSKSAKTSSWALLLEHVNYIKNNPTACDTFIIDTGDWAEKLCANDLCATAGKKSIEDFGYGKGYPRLAESFGKLLNALEELIDLGINVVIVCHAQMRKFEQPDEMGAYDRWELKLTKYVAPMVKEWADMVLFANYETIVVKTEDKKNKAQGGKRVIYTSHHPAWDAKNRHGLTDKIPFDYSSIAHCIVTRGVSTTKQNPVPETRTEQKSEPPKPETKPETKPDPAPVNTYSLNDIPDAGPSPDVPKPLADLMAANNVTVAEIQQAVASRGYYPVDTPISNYDSEFINGVLVGAWPQVFAMIKQAKES
ncbi:MAG: phage protein [Peptococcaceae bacterium BICA1-7]|nr:MAG: phage protein [Peptococcaceae bacterium BICA1-7]HBV97747.1 hypothetical protein [Desulfotomaculum sp.]